MNFGKMPLRLFITILEAIIARKVFFKHLYIMAYIYVVYTIIIFTYKYLEQCFTSITYYSSYWSSCNFVTIFNKISPTILGFAHMLEDPYKYISAKALTKWSTWCKVPCPGQIYVVESHTRDDHNFICTGNSHTHPSSSSSLSNGLIQ